jgi:hypothetical protein
LFFPFCTQLVLEEWKKKVNPRHFAFPCRVVWPSCLSSPLYQTFESILLAKQLPVSVWHDCCHFPTAPPPLENVSKYSTYAFFQTKKGWARIGFILFLNELHCWRGWWLAKSIEQVAVEILLNSRGKNPRTRVVLGWCPGFQ